MADIICRDIRKTYGGNIVHDGFSHTFKNGSVTVITGPSGCGKTTLLRMIAGLELPDSGIITGGGLHNCAFSFSDDRLFEEFSALDNITCVVPRRERHKRQGNLFEKSAPALQKTPPTHAARELLLALGLDDDAIVKLVQTFSGGMKRRVSIARAFAAERPVILLDEPTAGLDADTRSILLKRVREMQR